MNQLSVLIQLAIVNSGIPLFQFATTHFTVGRGKLGRWQKLAGLSSAMFSRVRLFFKERFPPSYAQGGSVFEFGGFQGYEENVNPNEPEDLKSPSK